MGKLRKISFFLLPVIVVFTTLGYGAVHEPIIAVFYLLTALMAAFWLGSGVFGGELPVSRSLIQLPLVLLAGYAVIQVIPFGSFTDASGLSSIPRTISLSPFATQTTALHLFFLSLVLSVALSNLDRMRRVRTLVTFLMVFGFFYAFYAILQSVLSPDKIYGIYKPVSAKPFGSFVNRHDFAAVIEMLIAIPLALLFAGSLRPDKRLVYVVAVVLMAAALLLSGSRGGLVALVAQVLIIVILTTRLRGRKDLLVKAGLSVLLILAAIGGAIFVGGETSLTRFADSAASDDVTSSRTQIWRATGEIIRTHMPFGAGLGAFPEAYAAVDPASGFEKVEYAHNDYLQIAADAGLPGIAIGLLFLFLFVNTASKVIGIENKLRRGIAVGAFAGCSAVLVHSMFDFVLHIAAISVLFLTLLAVQFASLRTFPDDVADFDDDAPRRRRKKAVVTPIDQAAVK